LDDTITAVGFAVGVASLVGTIASTIIAVFVEVSSFVTADGADAVGTALRRVNTVGSVIALLSVAGVGHTVTAGGEDAVLSAGIGFSVAVGGTVIALLETISEVDLSVTALFLADGRAAIEVVSVAIIALL